MGQKISLIILVARDVEGEESSTKHLNFSSGAKEKPYSSA
jgi:hypothetical protein